LCIFLLAALIWSKRRIFLDLTSGQGADKGRENADRATCDELITSMMTGSSTEKTLELEQKLLEQKNLPVQELERWIPRLYWHQTEPGPWFKGLKRATKRLLQRMDEMGKRHWWAKPVSFLLF